MDALRGVPGCTVSMTGPGGGVAAQVQVQLWWAAHAVTFGDWQVACQVF